MRRRARGFTLIEVMLATVLTVVGTHNLALGVGVSGKNFVHRRVDKPTPGFAVGTRYTFTIRLEPSPVQSRRHSVTSMGHQRGGRPRGAPP